MVVLKSIYNLFLNFFSPPFCQACQHFLNERTILCKTCLQKIVPIVTHSIALNTKCKIPVYALGAYQDPLKSLILAKHRSFYLANIYLANAIYEKTVFRDLPCDFLIPIPLHWSRRLKRGYNQSLVMAQRLQQLRTNVLVADILKRKKFTKYQSGLDKDARIQNLKKAFGLKKINSENFRNKHLILIDDVFTTGATLMAAATELLKLQPKTLAIIVAARAI